MANRTFELNLDLSKVDKNKIYIGKKGKYYKTRVVLREEEDQYGNTGFVQTASTKEERDNGYEASFVGNLKEFKYKDASEPASQEEVEDDLGF